MFLISVKETRPGYIVFVASAFGRSALVSVQPNSFQILNTFDSVGMQSASLLFYSHGGQDLLAILLLWMMLIIPRAVQLLLHQVLI